MSYANSDRADCGSIGTKTFGCRGSKRRIGVILLQLGTPDAPTPGALRRYLSQFLRDPRVIELPKFLWYPILFGIILITRPRRSARLYKRIWGQNGSPLLEITDSQSKLLKSALTQSGIDCEVTFGMRYGNPSIASALKGLISKGCRRIVAVPMYPQYCASTTASTYDALFPELLKERWVPTLRVVEPYYQDPDFIEAAAKQVERKLASIEWKPERIIFSYHGVPKRYVGNGDPYCCMCVETTELLRARLKLDKGMVIHTFQSRFGPEPWLTPYTDETIEKLASEGIKNILVVCPGFSADCLETLDEIGNEALHSFRERGGQNLELIPGVNDTPEFIQFLQKAVRTVSSDWLAEAGESACQSCPSRMDQAGKFSDEERRAA